MKLEPINYLPKEKHGNERADPDFKEPLCPIFLIINYKKPCVK